MNDLYLFSGGYKSPLSSGMASSSGSKPALRPEGSSQTSRPPTPEPGPSLAGVSERANQAPCLLSRAGSPETLLHTALPHFSSGTRAPSKQQVPGTLRASGPGTQVEQLHESTTEWEQRPVFRAQRPCASRNATIKVKQIARLSAFKSSA